MRTRFFVTEIQNCLSQQQLNRTRPAESGTADSSPVWSNYSNALKPSRTNDSRSILAVVLTTIDPQIDQYKPGHGIHDPEDAEFGPGRTGVGPQAQGRC